MANQTISGNPLHELALRDEETCRWRVQAAIRQLRHVRLKIHAIEESIAKCSRQAVIAFRNGNETVGRGNRREVQGLTLLRGRTIAHLAEAKAALAEGQERLTEAIGYRQSLGLPEPGNQLSLDASYVV
jgi:hypothetical protein